MNSTCIFASRDGWTQSDSDMWTFHRLNEHLGSVWPIGKMWSFYDVNNSHGMCETKEEAMQAIEHCPGAYPLYRFKNYRETWDIQKWFDTQRSWPSRKGNPDKPLRPYWPSEKLPDGTILYSSLGSQGDDVS